MKNLTIKELKEKFSNYEDEEIGLEVCGKVNMDNGTLKFGETVYIDSLMGHADYWEIDNSETLEDILVSYLYHNDFIEIKEDYRKDEIEIEDVSLEE